MRSQIYVDLPAEESLAPNAGRPAAELSESERSDLRSLAWEMKAVGERDARILVGIMKRLAEIEAVEGGEAALVAVERLRAILFDQEQ